MRRDRTPAQALPLQLSLFLPRLLVANSLLPTIFCARDSNRSAREGYQLLTNVAIKAFKPAGKPYKKADSGGLFILIQPNVAKIWRFAYRYDGKQKLLSGGAYPETTLLAARAWREMKHQLALGLEPSRERKNAKAKAAGLDIEAINTFEHVAREWLQTRTLAWTPRYAALVPGRLEGDIFPAIGKLDIGTITPRQMLEAVRKIEARGAVEMARRVKNHCSEIFRYAIPDGRCESDPYRDLTPAMTKVRPVKHRPKVAVKDLSTF